MTEYERIVEFMEGLDERVAERLVPTPYGPVVVHERLARVHDLNFLRADAPQGASASQLAATAERVQGPLDLRHRRVIMMDRRESDRLRPEFVELGWKPTGFVAMARLDGSDRTADRSLVREVGAEEVRPVWLEGLRSEPSFRDDEEVVQQLVAVKDVIAAAVPTRYYVAEVGDEIAAYCELYSADGVGQVEAVLTLEQYRGRGLASAVVLEAVARSEADANELTFLMALEDDWPRELYARLGFRAVGYFDSFLKTVALTEGPARRGL